MNGNSKFRKLTAEELALVAGGSMTITCGPFGPDIDWGYGFGDFGWSYAEGDGQGGGGGGEQPSSAQELTAAEEESTRDSVQSTIAILDDNILKYGDAVIKLPNGQEFVASAILAALGTTLDIIDAGNFEYAAQNGNLDIAATASFFAGLGGGSVEAAVGSGSIAVFATAVATGMFSETGLTQLAANVAGVWGAAYQGLDPANPSYSPGQALTLFIQSLFGTASAPAEDPVSYDSTRDSEPYWSYAFRYDSLHYAIP